MADDELLAKVQGVSDLELAALLSLICREHCIISTESDALDRLVQELQLVTTNTFALKPVVVDCTPDTTLEDFATGIQLPPALLTPLTPSGRRSPSPHQANPSTYRGRASYHGGSYLAPLTPATTGGDTSQVANVILAINLNHAPKAVQIQALELLRTKRLFTRSGVLVAPRPFLFIAVLAAPSGGHAKLTPHLNDFLYLTHWHDPEDGFIYLDLELGGNGKDSAFITTSTSDNDTASLESVVRTKRGSYVELESRPHSRASDARGSESLFTENDISKLATLSQDVSVDIEVTRYQMNIVSFLRMHRAVAGGVSPAATKHFGQLMRCLAPLHGLDFVTPALVGLAAKKVYLHRIQVVTPEKERSMQWGSDTRAVKEILHGVEPEDIIDDVLHMVATPL